VCASSPGPPSGIWENCTFCNSSLCARSLAHQMGNGTIAHLYWQVPQCHVQCLDLGYRQVIGYSTIHSSVIADWFLLLEETGKRINWGWTSPLTRLRTNQDTNSNSIPVGLSLVSHPSLFSIYTSLNFSSLLVFYLTAPSQSLTVFHSSTAFYSPKYPTSSRASALWRRSTSGLASALHLVSTSNCFSVLF
jgi:hypothetical protein